MTPYKAFFTALYYYRLCFHKQRTFGLSIKRVFVCLNVNFKTVISLRRELVLCFCISNRVFWLLLIKIDLSSSVSKAIYFLLIRATSRISGTVHIQLRISEQFESARESVTLGWASTSSVYMNGKEIRTRVRWHFRGLGD